MVLFICHIFKVLGIIYACIVILNHIILEQFAVNFCARIVAKSDAQRSNFRTVKQETKRRDSRTGEVSKTQKILEVAVEMPKI